MLLILASLPCFGQQTQRLYLSGRDKDDTVDWEFKVTGGRQSGSWTTISVPSNWELEGFGSYTYGLDGVRNEKGRSDEQGLYRYRFDVPERWQGKKMRLVFEGVMTDAEVRVNGQLAGPVHRGAFYRFGYDVTDLLQYSQENLLEVTVSKESSDPSVNAAEREADYWVFGGIFRPVYLEARPPRHIRRFALDARANGALRVEAHLGKVSTAGRTDARVTAQVQTLDGAPVGESFSKAVSVGDSIATLQAQIKDPKTWTPEFPNRYQVVVRLESNGEELHRMTEKFGFRTVELRPQDGLYVNGQKVHLKGVNRHSFWPTSGRTTSRAVSEMDVKLMKSMNMNAVRMSHYPPDEHFLQVCDSLGLFVIDELSGWGGPYDTAVGAKLIGEMVTRDVNHPSIVLWANGNEGNWNPALDDDFVRYDPQDRPVIRPWATFGGINTGHYRGYGCCAGKFFHGREVFMPTEFLHGLYDGGHAASLGDWWGLMIESQRSAGGFLWALLDEAVLRTDWQNEAGDDTLDTDGNHAPDGIVGPYRKAKEGSFFAIKKIWSPVYVRESRIDRLAEGFDGTFHLENRYYYTDLSQLSFVWRLVDFPRPTSADTGYTVKVQGTSAAPAAPPWTQATINLGLPDDWRSHDALLLEAIDPDGREIFTWSWMIKNLEATRRQIVHVGQGRVTGKAGNGRITLSTGSTQVVIDAATGQLANVQRGEQTLSLANGPRLIARSDSLTEIGHYADSTSYVVEAAYGGNLGLERVSWRLVPSGWLKLDYQYRLPHGNYNNVGVTFDYPEEEVTGMRWLGRGPYRVWKNRQEGVRYGVWQKNYNDTRTGIAWNYPEFKGYHANLHWAQLQTREGPITVVTDTDDLFLRLFTPQFGPNPRDVEMEFPPGDLSFLHGIAPIGTKFHEAEEIGPSGTPNSVDKRDLYEGTLYFYFGSDVSGPSTAR